MIEDGFCSFVPSHDQTQQFQKINKKWQYLTSPFWSAEVSGKNVLFHVYLPLDNNNLFPLWGESVILMYKTNWLCILLCMNVWYIPPTIKIMKKKSINYISNIISVNKMLNEYRFITVPNQKDFYNRFYDLLQKHYYVITYNCNFSIL